MAGRGDDDPFERESERLTIGRMLTEENRAAEKLVRRAMRSLMRGRKPPSRRAMQARPSVNGATSFHFSHTSVSKRLAPKRQTTAVPFALRAPPAWSGEPGRAARYQRYIEGKDPPRPDALERDEEGREVSFGNLGDSQRDRERFWGDAERRERANGRVQCRLIVELPHELTADQRKQALRRFCDRAFGEQRLAYWAVVHRPDPHGDQRNYHSHIAYYDRPGERDERGVWSFAPGKGRALYPWGTESPVSREKRLEKRVSAVAGAGTETVAAQQLAEVQEWRAAKKQPDRTLQVEGWRWIKKIRGEFAEAMNEELSLAGQARRYDPRRYTEMGISMPAARHLGPARTALERRGVMTDVSAHEILRREAIAELQSVKDEEALLERAGREVAELKSWPVLDDADEMEKRRLSAVSALGKWIEDMGRVDRWTDYRRQRDEYEGDAIERAILAGAERVAAAEERVTAERDAKAAEARRQAARQRAETIAVAQNLALSDVSRLMELGTALPRDGARPAWSAKQMQRYAGHGDVLESVGVAVAAGDSAAAALRKIQEADVRIEEMDLIRGRLRPVLEARRRRPQQPDDMLEAGLLAVSAEIDAARFGAAVAASDRLRKLVAQTGLAGSVPRRRAAEEQDGRE